MQKKIVKYVHMYNFYSVYRMLYIYSNLTTPKKNSRGQNSKTEGMFWYLLNTTNYISGFNKII